MSASGSGLQVIDRDGILSELIGLQTAWTGAAQSDGEFTWETTKLHVKRLRAMLPDDPDLVENVPVSVARQLADYLTEVCMVLGLDAERGTVAWGPDSRQYDILKKLIWDFTPERSKGEALGEWVEKERCRLGIAQPEAGLMGTTATAPEKRFRIALSFPGERRAFVEQVAARLAESLARERVLYDKYHEAEFARIGLGTYLPKLYHEQSELIAVFLCAEYERKEWCALEWRPILDLIKRGQTSRIMPFRFDDTEIPGLFSTDGYVSIGDRTPDDIANLILERLRAGC